MYTIKRAAELTGVSAATLRAWERRYDVVEPQRTDADSVLEKLPMRMTRSSPSSAARRGDGSGSKSAKMSSSTMISSLRSARPSRRCAICSPVAVAR